MSNLFNELNKLVAEDLKQLFMLLDLSNNNPQKDMGTVVVMASEANKAINDPYEILINICKAQRDMLREKLYSTNEQIKARNELIKFLQEEQHQRNNQNHTN